MNVVPPTWSLRKPCPCCGQGSPTLATCPACHHVVAICGELGTIFPDPRDLSRRLDDRYGDGAACPACGTGAVDEFPDSTSAEIQALGFTPDDHE